MPFSSQLLNLTTHLPRSLQEGPSPS